MARLCVCSKIDEYVFERCLLFCHRPTAFKFIPLFKFQHARPITLAYCHVETKPSMLLVSTKRWMRLMPKSS